jgi:hypothetical protein
MAGAITQSWQYALEVVVHLLSIVALLLEVEQRLDDGQ